MPAVNLTVPVINRRYLLLDAVGAGGMARVVRAFDRLDERVVALKLPRRPGTSGPAHPFTEEFVRWSRLDHDNVVRAHDLLRAESGPVRRDTPILVLEAVNALPIHRAIRPGSVPESVLDDIASETLAGLDHVHRRGLVHRDVKPANLLAGSAETGLAVKLTDFGLACERGAREEPGRISGSLPYVSPESIAGRPVDGRADLYGLGLVLFLLATGRMPFGLDDPVEVLRWHATGPPADPHSLRPDLSSRWSRFVRRLTARHPDARPATAAAALELLGLPGPERRARPVAGRARSATLRLAFDAVRLGGARVHALPADGARRAAVLEEARVLARVHGGSFVFVRDGGIVRALRELLMLAGGDASELVRRHRLHRGLPIELLGGVPMWGRTHDGWSTAPPDAVRPLARALTAFIADLARRGTVVLAFDDGAPRDALSRAALAELTVLAADGPAPCPGQPRLLVLAPGGGEDCRNALLPDAAPVH